MKGCKDSAHLYQMKGSGLRGICISDFSLKEGLSKGLCCSLHAGHLATSWQRRLRELPTLLLPVLRWRWGGSISCATSLPLACDSALIQRDELTQIGPKLPINNADFAAIIRKRKAVDARDVVIVFDAYQRVDAA